MIRRYRSQAFERQDQAKFSAKMLQIAVLEVSNGDASISTGVILDPKEHVYRIHIEIEWTYLSEETISLIVEALNTMWCLMNSPDKHGQLIGIPQFLGCINR